jgi:thymidylate synthase
MRNEQQYLDLLKDTLETGTVKSDRTGTGTISKFGGQMTFDLRDGKIPVITTKKVFWKGAVVESLWFLKGSTDVTFLQERGVSFWDGWLDEKNTIGPGYGLQFRNIKYITPITPKIFTPEPIGQIKVQEKVLPEYNTDSGGTSYKIGDIIDTDFNGKITLIKEVPLSTSNNRVSWIVQFHNTGYVGQYTYGDIKSGKCFDPYSRSVFGVGYYGNYNKKDPNYNMLVNTWRDMIRRCYYKKCKSYKNYGAKGFHVDSRWHSFEQFQKDFTKIPNWELKLEYPNEYSLDKDILFASNKYSVDTCIWATHAEQSANTSTNIYFEANSPQGEKLKFTSIGYICRKFKLNPSAVFRCLNKKLKTHKGWSNFNPIICPEGQVLRYREIDQLKLVIASIKHNPDSRRHIISLWNIHDVDRMELPPCHGNIIQFYVSNGELSCHMYQRSCDLFLGGAINIASYSLLTHLIAHECGLKAGDFIHSFGDRHIYLNHVDQVKEQLSRTPMQEPAIQINIDEPLLDFVDNCHNLSWDEIKQKIVLQNYKSHGSIKAEVAI